MLPVTKVVIQAVQKKTYLMIDNADDDEDDDDDDNDMKKNKPTSRTRQRASRATMHPRDKSRLMCMA